jgi:exosortase/archaeosortase family protein
LIWAGQNAGWISSITQTLLGWVIGFAGIEAAEGVEGFQMGKLWVPWSPGCSGYNGLILLVILTLWLGRKGPLDSRFMLRILITLPAALLANLLRILCILAYRMFAYPNNESPELHFLIGFITILPFVHLLNRQVISTLPLLQRLEILYFAVIFSLVIPITWEPNGWQVALSATSIMALFLSPFPQSKNRWALWSWISIGLMIGLSKMESLWLPWSITCPVFFDGTRILRRPFAWLILLSTITLVVIQPFWQWLLWPALMIEWSKFNQPTTQALRQDSTIKNLAWIILIGFTFPFILPTLHLKLPTQETIPPQAIVKKLKKNQYLLQFVGQQEDLRIYWYQSAKNDRHHAAATCMQFSESNFEQLSENLLASESLWIFEQFIVNEQLLNTYRDYLVKTWAPWSSTGAHLIITGSRNELDREAFEFASLQAVERWFEPTYQ